MCAIALCSVWPDEQRQHEERAEHQHEAQHDLEHLGHSAPRAGLRSDWRTGRSGRGPQTSGSGTPGGRSCAGSARRCRPRRTRRAPSRPATPWRRGRRARSPCAAGGPRSRRAAAAGRGAGGRRRRCRTSRRSPARARPPRRRRRSPREHAGRRAGTRVRSSRCSRRASRPEVGHDVEARLVGVVELVDRGQPVEVGEPQLVAGGGQRVDPGRRRARRRCPGRTTTRRRAGVPLRQARRPASCELVGSVTASSDRDRR